MAFRFLAFIVFCLFIISLIDLLITLYNLRRERIKSVAEEVFIDLCVDREPKKKGK